jgi:FtsP/CotA-like multicopper oxidase with cupredoxin domain
MALSLSNFLVCLIALLPKGLIPGANAATVTHDFNVGWVRANPDGQAERSVIGINGQWPLPLLNFTKGDRVIINLHNQVGRVQAGRLYGRLTYDSLVTKARVHISTACISVERRIWMVLSVSLSATSLQDIR